MGRFAALVESALRDSEFRRKAEILWREICQRVRRRDFAYEAPNYVTVNPDENLTVLLHANSGDHSGTYNSRVHPEGSDVINVKVWPNCFYGHYSTWDEESKRLAYKNLIEALEFDHIKRTMIHELIHYLDSQRGVPMKGTWDPYDIAAYQNHPVEMNAWFQAAIHSIQSRYTLRSMDIRRFLEMFCDAFGYEHWRLLTTANQKRLKKRAAEVWSLAQEREVAS